MKILFNDIETDKLPKNITLDIKGNNHTLILNSFIGNGILHIKLRGDNSSIIFGKNNIIERNLSINGNNYLNKICKGKCVIGTGNKFRGNCALYLPLNPDKEINIGNNNLFAANTEIIGCTEHPVYDMETNDLLNTENNVIIGDNNWIGRDVLFLTKGGIKDNCVVGIRSVVTKQFELSNAIIAGNPAKIKRLNIYWKEGYEE